MIGILISPVYATNRANVDIEQAEFYGPGRETETVVNDTTYTATGAVTLGTNEDGRNAVYFDHLMRPYPAQTYQYTFANNSIWGAQPSTSLTGTSGVGFQTVVVTSTKDMHAGLGVSVGKGPSHENVLITQVTDGTHFKATFTKSHTSTDSVSFQPFRWGVNLDDSHYGKVSYNTI